MMKKLLVAILSFVVLFALGFTIIDADHGSIMGRPMVNITLKTNFDPENIIINTTLSGSYGTTLTVNTNIASQDNYAFAYWVINGIVRFDLPVNHAFPLTTNIEIEAVFSRTVGHASGLQHAVLFMDSNGKLIQIQYVVDNGTASDVTEGLPSKPGYVIGTPKWDALLTNITADSVRILQYSIDTTTEFTLSLQGGTALTAPLGTGKYLYNTVVSVEADQAPLGEVFLYWELDGQIASYNQIYKFTMLSDYSVEAVYGVDSVTPVPLITMRKHDNLRLGKTSYVGQFYLPTGYTLIEYGLITSNNEELITLDSSNITNYQGLKHVGSTGEFLMSVPDSHARARIYMVIQTSAESPLITIYNQPLAQVFVNDFEDATSKTAYAIGLFVSSGLRFILDDALATHSDASDAKEGTRSIRMQNSNNPIVTTDHTVSYLHQISFLLGRYGTDSLATITVSISNDNETWINLRDDILTPTTIEMVNIELDYDALAVNGITLSDDLYIRFTSNAVGRANIDNLTYLYGDEGRIDATGYQYTVTLSTDQIGATVEASIAGPYSWNQTISVTASTVEGYTFKGWYNDEILYSLSNPLSLNVRESLSLVAVYEETTIEPVASYQTGFESADGFTAGTVYNNATIKYGGPTGQQWGTYYGTASTTSPISGSQSMQIRWYTTATANLGYTFTNFDTANVAQINFLAANLSGLNVTVLISIDGGTTYIADELFILTTTPTTYTYNVPIAYQSESIRVKFIVTLPNPLPTETSRLYIDNIEYIINVTPPIEDKAPEIALHPDTKLAISIGDIYTDYGCTAMDDIDGEVGCDKIGGTVDTNTIGEYTITYYAVDSSNNESFLVVTVVVMRDATILDVLLSEYYSNAQGLYGIELLLALNAILNTGVTMQTYDDARDILQLSDADPLNSNNIILVYLGTSVNGTWDLGSTWNREHVFPQSLLNVTTSGSSRHAGADLHNLKPANPSENSSRSNKYFDWTTTSSTYAPRDEVKGDVARILFYMITMYDHLDLVNITPSVYEMALLDVLLEWHYLDQVDAFENNRNDIIYSYQSNRNPFIDYPHLVELLWWNYQPLIDLLNAME